MVESEGRLTSMPSTFWVYKRRRRPSAPRAESMRWKSVGSAVLTSADRLRTMSWKEEVEEDVW